MDRARGIDVSHYHPITDANAVIASGVRFVGIKATQGITFVDPKLSAHRMAVRQQPFDLVIYYHFAAPGDAVKQADHFLDVLGELRGNERVCLDLEDDKTGRPAVDLAWADTFYSKLLAGACTDRRPLIYTSRRVWLQLGNPAWDLASEIDLWAPRYGPDEPELPVPWKLYGWKFWQYSEEGVVPGIQGPCDLSVFSGDRAALQVYALTR
jgi:lysozyme